MMPQMSVLPSRPLATKTSGGCQPLALSAVMSASSSLQTSLPSDDPPQLVDRRHVHPAVGVDEIAAIGRELDRVVAVALGERDQAGAVEVDAVVMDEVRVLVRVLAAGAEPDLAASSSSIRSMPRTTYSPLGDRVLDLAGLRVDQVEVPPAVALGDVDDLVGLVEPVDGAAGPRSRRERSR